ncbi:MAG TPA: hypothetical protein VMU68_14290 [Acidimicrobiales bacterium]|nr:hypothetical protein [Acidimicrobiales bacterium]
MRQFQATTTYQVTDLARRYREVLDEAREHDVLVRDKDGATLIITMAEEVSKNRELVSISSDLLRLSRAVDASRSEDVANSGQFAWLSILPEANRKMFVNEVMPPMLVALSGGSLRPLIDLIGDWKATADVWADESLREELMERVDAPLFDVSL